VSRADEMDDDVDDGWTAEPRDIPEVRELESNKAERARQRQLKAEGRWREPWEE
jgi:hypothetical protein